MSQTRSNGIRTAGSYVLCLSQPLRAKSLLKTFPMLVSLSIQHYPCVFHSTRDLPNRPASAFSRSISTNRPIGRKYRKVAELGPNSATFRVPWCAFLCCHDLAPQSVECRIADKAYLDAAGRVTAGAQRHAGSRRLLISRFPVRVRDGA